MCLLWQAADKLPPLVTGDGMAALQAAMLVLVDQPADHTACALVKWFPEYGSAVLISFPGADSVGVHPQEAGVRVVGLDSWEFVLHRRVRQVASACRTSACVTDPLHRCWQNVL
jgi:hypothetical protein